LYDYEKLFNLFPNVPTLKEAVAFLQSIQSTSFTMVLPAMANLGKIWAKKDKLGKLPSITYEFDCL